MRRIDRVLPHATAPRALAGLALLVAFAVGAGACGDDDGKGSPGGTSGSAPTAPPPQTTGPRATTPGARGRRTPPPAQVVACLKRAGFDARQSRSEGETPSTAKIVATLGAGRPPPSARLYFFTSGEDAAAEADALGVPSPRVIGSVVVGYFARGIARSAQVEACL